MKKTVSFLCAVPLLAIVAAAVIASLGSCKQCNPPQQSAADTLLTDSLDLGTDGLSEQIPDGADNLFDDFLYGFMSGHEAQVSRIKWPLECVSHGKRTYRRENEWGTELFFLPQGYYTLILEKDSQREFQADTLINRAVVEKIFLDKSSIQQYEFRKGKSGKWMLCRLKEIGFGESPNASFLKFYNRFATDETFQIKSIANTLEFSGPNPDNSLDNIDGIITAEQWPVFAPQLPRDVLYNIVYGNFRPSGSQRVLLICNVASEYGSELTFSRQGGQWKLRKIVM